MSSEQKPQKFVHQKQRKSTLGYLVELVIAFKWPITAVLGLLTIGLITAVVSVPQVPPQLLRIVAIVCLLTVLTIVVLWPTIFLCYLWVTWRQATPVVIGDSDHKQVHAKLVSGKALSQMRFTEGLPRQRMSDLGAAYVVMDTEGDEDAERDPETGELVRETFDTPLTEQQPSWLDLVESERYQEWRKIRVDMTKIVKDAVEEKQSQFREAREHLYEQANRLTVGFQRDLELSDVDDLDSEWDSVESSSSEKEPDGPDRVDDVVSEEALEIIENSKARRNDD